MKSIFRALAAWLYTTYPNQWKTICIVVTVLGLILLGITAVANSRSGFDTSNTKQALMMCGFVFGAAFAILGLSLLLTPKDDK